MTCSRNSVNDLRRVVLAVGMPAWSNSDNPYDQRRPKSPCWLILKFAPGSFRFIWPFIGERPNMTSSTSEVASGGHDDRDPRHRCHDPGATAQARDADVAALWAHLRLHSV
eukprot:CAMPEP_0115875024 /NCGR_PEP_ID=MMETSP0287-20121206/24868_1 /TAXON_ID=412157 /ORGANISM="Chrysochromulina rotalis, Strain UIO044" /LENGTH=110 /DNA_ID=CAMNT_0003330243 /DNA_START=183 /DNA_END=512 /DNA_ORIENTATION=+